jgi:hypothetical protein
MKRTLLLLGALVLSASTCALYAEGKMLKQALAIESSLLDPVASPTDPEATYHGARIVHNVTVKGQKGMRVHASFTVKHGLNNPSRLIAYFYYDDDENSPLESADPNYRTEEGNVSARSNFTPKYDPAYYKDLQLFIPYEALNMESGEEYDLKFYLALYDDEGERFFGKSPWYKFKLTMP